MHSHVLVHFQRHVHSRQHLLPETWRRALWLQGRVQDVWHQHNLCAGNQLLQQHGMWVEPSVPQHSWLQSVCMCYGLQIVQRGLCSVKLLH